MVLARSSDMGILQDSEGAFSQYFPYISAARGDLDAAASGRKYTYKYKC